MDLQELEDDDTISPIQEPVTQQNIVEPQLEVIEEEVETQELRRSSRKHQESKRYLGFLVARDVGELTEPKSYKEAI